MIGDESLCATTFHKFPGDPRVKLVCYLPLQYAPAGMTTRSNAFHTPHELECVYTLLGSLWQKSHLMNVVLTSRIPPLAELFRMR